MASLSLNFANFSKEIILAIRTFEPEDQTLVDSLLGIDVATFTPREVFAYGLLVRGDFLAPSDRVCLEHIIANGRGSA